MTALAGFLILTFLLLVGTSCTTKTGAPFLQPDLPATSVPSEWEGAQFSEQLRDLSIGDVQYEAVPIIDVIRDVNARLEQSRKGLDTPRFLLDVESSRIAADASVAPYSREAFRLVRKFREEFGIDSYPTLETPISLKAEGLTVLELCRIVGLAPGPAVERPDPCAFTIILQMKDTYECRAYEVSGEERAHIDNIGGLPTYFPKGQNPRTVPPMTSFSEPCLAGWVPGTTNVMLVITTPFNHSLIAVNPELRLRGGDRAGSKDRERGQSGVSPFLRREESPRKGEGMNPGPTGSRLQQ